MEDAARLRKLFETVKNRAKFARDYDVPGGSAMIYQHINGITPIGLDAALAYMRGFGCRMEDISPSLAKKQSFFLIPPKNRNHHQKTNTHLCQFLMCKPHVETATSMTNH